MKKHHPDREAWSDQYLAKHHPDALRRKAEQDQRELAYLESKGEL